MATPPIGPRIIDTTEATPRRLNEIPPEDFYAQTELPFHFSPSYSPESPDSPRSFSAPPADLPGVMRTTSEGILTEEQSSVQITERFFKLMYFMNLPEAGQVRLVNRYVESLSSSAQKSFILNLVRLIGTSVAFLENDGMAPSFFHRVREDRNLDYGCVRMMELLDGAQAEGGQELDGLIDEADRLRAALTEYIQ